MNEKKIFSIDRLEGELAVCISDDDVQVTVPCSSLRGMSARDVFSARIEGEKLVEIEPMPEERELRLEKNRSRLHSLARRTKNKS